VLVTDTENEVDSIEVYINDILVGTSNGDYNLFSILGDHTIRVEATDADLDRGTEDQESNSDSASIWIDDDDETPPQISKLIIQDMIYYVDISFDAEDAISGISLIYITIGGIIVDSYELLVTENHFEFKIFNSWAMEIGEHNIQIEVWDADNDREGDALSTTETGTFTITFEDMKEFVIWEIEQVMLAIQESPDEQWGDPADQRKDAMLNKLIELKVLVISLEFEEAYDKLLHDIKPLLTGLKTDEDGIDFGNGIFKNAWVTSDDFEALCNQILADLQILITNF